MTGRLTFWVFVVAVIAGCVPTTQPPDPVPADDEVDTDDGTVDETVAPPRKDAAPLPASKDAADVAPDLQGADHPQSVDAQLPAVADASPDRLASLPREAGPVPNMDPTCAPDPRDGAACPKAFQVCRQSDGNPCNCSSKKVWVCATACPPDTRTNTITMRACDRPGQFCRRTPPPGSPTSTEADWCICGNHYGWDCLDIPVCKTGVTTGTACTPRSDPRPGFDRGRICQIPPPAGQSPEQICLCDVATVPTWKCQPTCPWGARSDGACNAGTGACSLLTPASVARGAIVGGIFVATCGCGEKSTLGCGTSVRYDYR